MTMRNGCLFGLAGMLISLSAAAQQSQLPGSEIVTFTADVTSAQGTDAGTIIAGTILYAPTNPMGFPGAEATISYYNLAPSVFSVVSNGALSDTQPLSSVLEQGAFGPTLLGGLEFTGGGTSSALYLNFDTLINPSANPREGAPVGPINLSDWGSATFTYQAFNSLENLIGQVTANVTSVNVVIPNSAPEIDAGTTPVAIVLVLGGIAIIRGRRIATVASSGST
jgi:hypothetical protein